ncbi:MAG: L-threonylcarbamoyladenylate synthase [Spirochaetia bacterium]
MHRKQPAIFLDRDGTIIEDKEYISDIDDVKIYEDTIPALQNLQKKYELFVISNQNGIAKGRISPAQPDTINQFIHKVLLDNGIFIRDWYVCPHEEKDNCQCMKPSSYFIEKANTEYHLDLKKSFTIGDHPHDVLTGKDYGVFGLYLLTGHGLRHLKELPKDQLVFHSISHAANWVLRHPEPKIALNSQITEGAQAIKEGGLTAFPTETVYGLGANALNKTAVTRIFEAKNRPLHDPLIVHISDKGQVVELTSEVPQKAYALMEAFWPGPLTLVFPKSQIVPEVVTSGGPTVAIRMPENPWALRLIQKAQTPIAAPSANLFGRTSPTTAEHVAEQLGSKCRVIIDAGACRVGVESTVLSLTQDPPRLLRAGGVSQDEIEGIIGPISVSGKETERKKEGPGMLKDHYAPNTPLYIVESIAEYTGEDNIGILLYSEPDKEFKGTVEVLSRSGKASDAAVNLYAAIRRLDALGLRYIVSELNKENGIGHALNDRLEKAAQKTGIPEKKRES